MTPHIPPGIQREPIDAVAWRYRWLIARRHFLKRLKKMMRNDGSIFDDINNAVAGYNDHTRRPDAEAVRR